MNDLWLQTAEAMRYMYLRDSRFQKMTDFVFEPHLLLAAVSSV